MKKRLPESVFLRQRRIRRERRRIRKIKRLPTFKLIQMVTRDVSYRVAFLIREWQYLKAVKEELKLRGIGEPK
jgi:hypothetical protein